MRRINFPIRTRFIETMFICILTAISGCQNQPPPFDFSTTKGATTIQAEKSAWTERWLKGVPCAPPCWEGVVPGQTSATEAVAALDRSPIIGSVRIETTQVVPDLGYILWTWNDGTEGGSALFHASSPEKEVYSINTALPSEFNLDNVIKVFGMPTHVIATAGRTPEGGKVLKDLRIVYARDGFYLPVKSVPLNLHQDMVTQAPVFFTPSDDLLSENLKVAPQFIVPWEGFKTYGFYCRDLEGGVACKSE